MTALAFMVPARWKPVGFFHLKIFQYELLSLRRRRPEGRGQHRDHSRRHRSIPVPASPHNLQHSFLSTSILLGRSRCKRLGRRLEQFFSKFLLLSPLAHPEERKHCTPKHDHVERYHLG